MIQLAQKTDDQLALLFAEGCSDAFDVLLRRYQADVHNYIFVLLNDEEAADDLFQDTFIKVIHLLKERKYKPSGKFKQWLIRVTHNMVMDHFRRLRSSLHPLSDSVNEKVLSCIAVDSSEGYTQALEREELFTLLDQQISLLPKEQRDVVRMRFDRQMSFKQIAEQTGVSINTALGRMRYALISLRKSVPMAM